MRPELMAAAITQDDVAEAEAVLELYDGLDGELRDLIERLRRKGHAGRAHDLWLAVHRLSDSRRIVTEQLR